MKFKTTEKVRTSNIIQLKSKFIKIDICTSKSEIFDLSANHNTNETRKQSQWLLYFFKMHVHIQHMDQCPIKSIHCNHGYI